MSIPKLSICIPTYNRADCLLKSLKNILPQINNNVQIAVSNNNSTDDTKNKLDNFKQMNPELDIKIIHQKINIGFDKNVLAVVNLADGEYCWLLSDDDLILDNSIKKIIALINDKSNTALFLCNYQRFDAKQNKITAKKMINLNNDIHFSNSDNFYFKNIPKSYFYILGTNMITMSVNIFKKSYWIEAENTVIEYIDLNFIHIFILSKLISLHPKIFFIAEPMVQYTCNNHRDWGNDIWNDYKKYFLAHLKKNGFNPDKINEINNSSINCLSLIEKIKNLFNTTIKQLFN